MKYTELQFKPPMTNIREDWEMVYIPFKRTDNGVILTACGCYFPETMSQNDAIREVVGLRQKEVDDMQKDIDAIKSFITEED